jgi:hypothetical protein
MRIAFKGNVRDQGKKDELEAVAGLWSTVAGDQGEGTLHI